MVKSRRMKKAPERFRNLPHFLAGDVHNQAVAVWNFLIVISSFARYQYYVPEWLLKAWNISVNSDLSGAA